MELHLSCTNPSIYIASISANFGIPVRHSKDRFHTVSMSSKLKFLFIVMILIIQWGHKFGHVTKAYTARTSVVNQTSGHKVLCIIDLGLTDFLIALKFPGHLSDTGDDEATCQISKYYKDVIMQSYGFNILQDLVIRCFTAQWIIAHEILESMITLAMHSKIAKPSQIIQKIHIRWWWLFQLINHSEILHRAQQYTWCALCKISEWFVKWISFQEYHKIWI